MVDVPEQVKSRRDRYCEMRSRAPEEEEPTWWGLEAFLWLTSIGSVLKVHRHPKEFVQELASYQRLKDNGVEMLQGFRVPQLLDYDENLLVLELSFVRPPYVVDFGRATVGRRPADFDPESKEWNSEKQRLYGSRWPEVVRLLDALRHLGIHYVDVHPRNICFEDPRSGSTAPSTSSGSEQRGTS